MEYLGNHLEQGTIANYKEYPHPVNYVSMPGSWQFAVCLAGSESKGSPPAGSASASSVKCSWRHFEWPFG